MRIRKHAKISPLLYTCSSLEPGIVIQPHVVCQLNQSPWDVMTFPPSSDPETPLPPPPPYQVDKDDSYNANDYFTDYIAANQSGCSMKFEVGNERKKWDHDMGIQSSESFDNGGTEVKQDGGERKGGQCRSKAKGGHNFSEHHSSQTTKSTNSSNSTHRTIKKSETRRRTRPKKPAVSSNPYEYYYYSGFGPRWGKKRGEPTAATPSVTKAEQRIRNDDSEMAADPNVATASTAEQEVSTSQSSLMDTEGFDYIEDDDDEEEDEDQIGETEKRRARKPIKARSLKSLM